RSNRAGDRQRLPTTNLSDLGGRPKLVAKRPCLPNFIAVRRSEGTPARRRHGVGPLPETAPRFIVLSWRGAGRQMAIRANRLERRTFLPESVCVQQLGRIALGSLSVAVERRFRAF